MKRLKRKKKLRPNFLVREKKFSKLVFARNTRASGTVLKMSFWFWIHVLRHLNGRKENIYIKIGSKFAGHSKIQIKNEKVFSTVMVKLLVPSGIWVLGLEIMSWGNQNGRKKKKKNKSVICSFWLKNSFRTNWYYFGHVTQFGFWVLKSCPKAVKLPNKNSWA